MIIFILELKVHSTIGAHWRELFYCIIKKLAWFVARGLACSRIDVGLARGRRVERGGLRGTAGQVNALLRHPERRLYPLYRASALVLFCISSLIQIIKQKHERPTVSC